MMDIITVEEAINLENKDKILILDLRTEESYKQFHIDQAIPYSLEKIENGEYCLPKDYCIVLYCEKGGLSLIGARILGQEGFCTKTVIGGMQAYKEYRKKNGLT